MKKKYSIIKEKVQEFKAPSVFVKVATVEDNIKAEQLAQAEFGKDYTAFQMVIAKIAILCTFDDTKYNCSQIANFPEDFWLELIEAINSGE